MNWLDILIIAFILAAGLAGYSRGFIFVGIDLLGLVLATIMAFILSPSLSRFLLSHLHLIPAVADIFAAVSVLVVAQIIYVLATRHYLHKLPPGSIHSHANRAAGALLNALRAGIGVALVLLVAVGLPAGPGLREQFKHSSLTRVLVSSSGRWQSGLQQLVGQRLTETISFLTVQPESEESIPLHFTVVEAPVDPAAEERMLVLVNNERSARGLRTLRMNEGARAVARQHSADMLARGYFSHTNPEGKNPFDRLKTGGVRFNSAGENLALAPNLDMAHTGLMNSPKHKDNILARDFGTVGIGIINAGKYGLMVTQNFTD